MGADQTMIGAVQSAYDALLHGSQQLPDFEEVCAEIAKAVENHTLEAYEIVSDMVDAAAVQIEQLVHDDAPTRDNLAVHFVDDRGTPVKDKDGAVVSRPKSPLPSFFVDEGLATKYGPAGYRKLLLFRQGRIWDMQRDGKMYFPEFVEYASIVIGLFGAASAINETLLLVISDVYAIAASTHRYSPANPRDPTFGALPARNIWNTRLGYQLYKTGRIGPSAARR
jgi:hypothetical protein